MTQELIERLEPCPFCGEPLEYSADAETWGHSEFASNCIASAILIFDGGDAALWNTRDQSQSARIAELEGVLEQVRDWRVNGAPDKWVATREEMRILARLALTKDSTSG